MKTLLTPFQKFVRIEGFSGILLFLATVSALIWANLFTDSYHALWQFKVGFSIGEFSLIKPLILWINDGLMAIFFFLIGLEIKRELLIGELNSTKKAAFPIFAALGGMTFPVLLFLLINQRPELSSGWAIPMATDIAFTLAILNLLGKRVPVSLKVFLTAFAIVDDIGAVLVIALFYSGGIEWSLLIVAILLLAFLFAFSSRGFYSRTLLMVLGALVWLLFLKAGIHPTVAGVLLAFTVPICQRVDFMTFSQRLKLIYESLKEHQTSDTTLLTKDQSAKIDELDDWTEKVRSPLQHLENKLHGFVAYFIMPVFALSNAGVVLGSDLQLDIPLIATIAICLVVGNGIGVTLMSLLGLRLGLAALPPDIRKVQIVGVAFLAGVGFTMSIFIANLAYAVSPLIIDSAKVGILLGSVISGTIGYLILRNASGAITAK